MKLPVLVVALATTAAATPAIAWPNSGRTEPAASDNGAATGECNLWEFRKTLTFQVNASQSKLFWINNKIVRTSVADPSIAEPVVLAENILLLLGRAPGETSLDIWDDDGKEAGINVIVEANRRPSAVCKHTANRQGASSEARQTTGTLPLIECADRRTSAVSTNGGQPPPTSLAAFRAVDPIFSHQPAENNIHPRPKRPKAPFKPREDIISWGEEAVIIDTGYKTGRTTKTIDLIEFQSRMFWTDEKLTKVVTTDPFIAEPVVVSTHEFVLLGKLPGVTQFEIQDAKGVTEAFDLKVGRNLGQTLSAIRSFVDAFSRHVGLEKATRAVPPAVTDTIDFSEQETTDLIDLKPSQPKFFKTKHAIVRISTADPDYAEVGLISTNELLLFGEKPGWTTICLWDEVGNVAKLDVHVGGPVAPQTRSRAHFGACPLTASPEQWQTPSITTGGGSSESAATPSSEVEIWSRSKKDVLSVPTQAY